MRTRLPLMLLPALLAAACTDSTPTAVDSAALGPVASAKRDAPVALASTSVVMSNLNSPRGLAWGPGGALYVAEAGATSVQGPCAPVPRGANCYSGMGAISRLWKGAQERIITGLPSVFNATTGDITGPHDIDFQGRGNGYVTIGWRGPPAARAALGALGASFGTLNKLRPSGGWSIEADISNFEAANNPEGTILGSNPYGVLTEPGRELVTDAGGNSLLEVAANGTVSLVATFPRIPAPPPLGESEQVPTEVVRGPDGALYVSTLTGVPFTN